MVFNHFWLYLLDEDTFPHKVLQLNLLWKQLII